MKRKNEKSIFGRTNRYMFPKPVKVENTQMPKYVYTAVSSKQDGLLIITDKDWDEFAKSQKCRIVKSVFGDRLLVGKGIKLTKKAIQNVFDDGYCGFDIWFLYRSGIVIDENLSSAVSW